MRPTNKLRVAIPDAADALDTVMTEVERTTGFEAQPVFQEVDHADLVVEVHLTDAIAADPSHIARTVERSSRDLEVLSTWHEDRLDPAGGLASADEMILDVIDDPLPETARRAVHDEVPTAQWLPTVKDVAGGDRSYWLLAVPLAPAGSPPVVAVNRRYGYSHRFSASEALAVRRRLAS